MGKIKKLFSGMVESVKKALDMFPITTMIIFALTLIVAFLVIDTDFSREVDELIAHIYVIGIFTAFGTWFVESLIDDKKDLRRVIGYVISLVIAILFDRLIKYEVLEETILVRWLVEYVIICFLSTVYCLLKKANESFEKYILNLLLNLKRASIICGIISIGFLIIYAIFTILISDALKFEIVLKILCLFAGFYYLPVVLKAFANEEAEDTRFNKAVFTKVLPPLLFISMAIIYIYIAKIFLVTEVPKNELFGILSFIFVCAFPVYLINKNYTRKRYNCRKIKYGNTIFIYTIYIFTNIFNGNKS